MRSMDSGIPSHPIVQIYQKDADELLEILKYVDRSKVDTKILDKWQTKLKSALHIQFKMYEGI